jgi:hypothetical protein
MSKNKVMETLEAFKAAGPPVNLRTLGVSVKQAAELPEGISGHLRKKDDGAYEAAASALSIPIANDSRWRTS